MIKRDILSSLLMTPSHDNRGKTGSEESMNDVQTPWWSWNSSNVTQVRPNVTQSSPEQLSWLHWLSPYQRVNSVMGYISYRDDGTAATTPTNESTPLLASSNGNSWFSWMWPGVAEDDEPYGDYTNNVELYKSAKAAIENSKDCISYAYKGTKTKQFFINDYELSVFLSPTQAQPVKYNIKRTPITPAEVQENGFQVVVTSNNPSPSVSGINSSSSSVNEPDNDNQNKSSRPPLKLPPPDINLSQNNPVIPNILHNFRYITLTTKLRLLGEKLVFGQNTSESHLYRQPNTKITSRKVEKIKKIVIIGVHGFLPTKFIKSMVGLSTGNSLKFVEQATKAVESWLNEDVTLQNMYNIETIALEGLGTIEDRVQSSLELLKNWSDMINDCDFLFFVGHSQGSIIAIHILAELLSSKSSINLNSHKKRIGLLSMAGPLKGPMPNLASKIVIRAYTKQENNVLQQLTRLGDSQSKEYTELQQSFQVLMDHNVKVTLAGSINDRLVPLNSSLAEINHHANIFRCIASDGQLVPTNSNLLLLYLWQLILTLRNLGVSERKLFQELSIRCAATTTYDYGHTNVYHDDEVYKTAVRFALETTDLQQKTSLNTYLELTPGDSIYEIPWNLRELVQGILRAKHINHLGLLNDVITSYNHWNPTTKAWKEVKLCLESLGEVDYDDMVV